MAEVQDIVPISEDTEMAQSSNVIMAPVPVAPTADVSELLTDPTPEYISETLYIQNLNEKIKTDGSSNMYYVLTFSSFFLSLVMKSTLRGLFKTYGEVLDVVAHSNLRMRGQAFVSFPSAEIAKKAQKEVNRFPLYSKPMVKCFSTRTHMMTLSEAFSCMANLLRQNTIRCSSQTIG